MGGCACGDACGTVFMYDAVLGGPIYCDAGHVQAMPTCTLGSMQTHAPHALTM